MPPSNALSTLSASLKKKGLSISATAVVMNMSFSRIIRGDGRVQKLKVSIPGEAKALSDSHDHVMDVEKQAFEQGYAEGERIGKEMGEKMVETIVKRYDHAIARLAETHKALADSMEEEIVRLALEISRKIVQREIAMDPDIVSAIAAVALKRVSNHQSITLRVNRQDFGSSCCDCNNKSS